MTYIKFIPAIIAPLFIFLILLELAGRVFNPAGISYYPEMARYLDTMIIEEPIGYRNNPGLQGDYFGVPVSINTFGMRNDEIPVEKAANEFRIILLGDSVPFGVGVTKDNMLTMQLQDMINKGKQSDIVYRVLNMGVPSYNTEQELIQLQHTGLTLDPDLVLLLFSLNDIESKMWVFDKRESLLADTIQRSYAGSLIFIIYRELQRQLSGVIRPAGAAEQQEELKEIFAGYRMDNERWESTRNSMLEISGLLKERDIPFVLLLNNGSRALSELWDREARTGGFLVTNLDSWGDSRWRNDDKTKYTNSFVDSHPNKEGNKILATLIYEFLTRKGLLSDSRQLSDIQGYLRFLQK